MSEWKIYRLGDICRNVCNGGTPKSTEPSYYGGNIPWLNTKEVNFCRINKTEKTITDSGFQNSSTKWIEKNSVIVAMYGATAAKVAVNMIPLTTNQACCNLTIDPNLADFRFVYFYLCHKYASLAALANGGAQQNLNAQRIKDFDITLPPLKEQKHIADILWSLDDKIELNRRINANLEAQAQALFRSWFVDFEPFRNGPFVDSELGKIPQGWKVKTLSNLATVIKKGITPSNSETYNHYSIPAYDDAHFPEKQSGETIKSGKYIVYNNSILLSKLNPRIKRLWFIKTAEENAICSTEFIPIQTKDTDLINFVFYLIDSDIFYQQALSLVNGATGSHQRFHAEDIMQIPFAWNEDTAIDFAQKANCILQKIEDNIRENQTLSALRDTLLPKLMNGEINVE